ncbi:MAG: hypothetical protein ACOX3E_00620 [Desulfomonilia bacterium]|jgi:hypothetical protein|uniref:Uncharacterized protein n=1 Tax=anaerobic digester metagenome TaxID=1263854 RepID=A0A485M3Z5_9ZZZZ|nr:hypothetical protein [Pseudomonadota bacterium]HPD22682.1 hypothetical protein [Deltaproteobacteria bacterium]
MSRRISVLVCFLLLSLAASAWGDGDGGGEPLTRSEVAQIKGVLKDMVAALGAQPSGYDALEEDYDLPATYHPHKNTGRFSPIYGGVRLRYGTDTAKIQKSMEQTAQEWQRKYLEATAKGDAEAITKLTQEYQAMIASIQLQAANASASHKEPIVIDIRLNQYQTAAIDPDGVVLEKPGFIALAEKSHRQDMGRVRCFFDPIALKQTETLSQVRLEYPQDGMAAKTSVSNVVIEFEGPEKDIQEWVKRIDTAAVLKKIK